MFQTAQKMAAHGIAGHFPFIVGFPEESDDSIRATIDVAKRLRTHQPAVPHADLLLQALSGERVVMEAVARGFRLPEGLEAWSEFDYVDGDPGPWVSREKFKLIERFKFFSELAGSPPGQGRPVAARGRARCSRDEYRCRGDAVHAVVCPSRAP